MSGRYNKITPPPPLSSSPQSVAWETVIIDEAHRMKSTGSSTRQVVAEMSMQWLLLLTGERAPKGPWWGRAEERGGGVGVGGGPSSGGAEAVTPPTPSAASLPLGPDPLPWLHTPRIPLRRHPRAEQHA